MRYTDPTGHFFSGLRHWVNENVLGNTVVKNIGAVVMVVGAVIGTVGMNPALGGSIMAFGASIIKYDPSQPQSSYNQISFSTSVRVGTFGDSGLSASQQYSITQGRADTAQLQPYLDSIGTRYVYGNSGSGDIESLRELYRNKFVNQLAGGLAQYEQMISYEYSAFSEPSFIRANRQIEHQLQINLTVDLMINGEFISQGVKDVFIDYRDNYYINYRDNPYLNRYGNFVSKDPIYANYRGGHRAGVTKTSPNGRGIQYTSTLFSYGYMSEQYLRTFIHEAYHDRMLNGAGHKHGFYKDVEDELARFYQSYPEYK